jgi:hypothetical protein
MNRSGFRKTVVIEKQGKIPESLTSKGIERILYETLRNTGYGSGKP